MKRFSALATYYVYSGEQIIAEYTSSGSLDYNYVYGLGQRLAKYKGTEKYLYHNDHLGSLRALTTPSGTVVGSQDYYPYGEKLALTGSPGKYAYNQKEYLDDWGFDLYYYGARFMDPVTGRFLTPDPVRDYLNPYSYVGNNPVNRIDPAGMAGQPPSNFSSATGYDFGGNPFRWANERIFRVLQVVDSFYKFQMARIKLAVNLEEAHKNARNLAASDLSLQERQKWEKIAEELGKRMGANFDKFYEVEEGKIYQTDEKGVRYEVLAYEENGVTHISSDYINSASDLSLQGTIIHEASHTVFNNTMKGEDYNQNFWRWSTQMYAYSAQYEYTAYVASQGSLSFGRSERAAQYWAEWYNNQTAYFFRFKSNYWDDLFANDLWVKGGRR